MLQNYSGIGAKVADCVMLFSMEKYSAFPVDVWVKRAMQYFYLAPDVSLKKNTRFWKGKIWRIIRICPTIFVLLCKRKQN